MSLVAIAVYTRPVFVALFLLVVSTPIARAQQVQFRVTNYADEAPVSKALVTSLNDRALWRTSDAGMLVVTVQHAGANVFTIRRIGLEPITTTLDVPDHDTLRVHVVMSAAPQMLDPVKVNAKMVAAAPQISAFDERRLHNAGGHFITLADIERSSPIQTLDLFNNVLGYRVVRPAVGDAFIESTRGTSTIASAGTTRTCRPQIGVDGAMYPSAFDVNDISPRDIYGIEIYSGGSTVPTRFLTTGVGGSCGLIMIWTFSGAQLFQQRAP